MMKKLICVFFSMSMLSAMGAFGSETARPMESLHDLPTKWEGSAGGLLQHVPATFTIERVRKVTRDDSSPNAFAATYDVDATMTLGERKLAVTQIVMNRYQATNQNYEVYIRVNDDLVQTVFAGISYDEASDTYQLREMVQHGERRFSLSAPARH